MRYERVLNRILKEIERCFMRDSFLKERKIYPLIHCTNTRQQSIKIYLMLPHMAILLPEGSKIEATEEYLEPLSLNKRDSLQMLFRLIPRTSCPIIVGDFLEVQLQT